MSFRTRTVTFLDLPKRKLMRLNNYDYRQNGAYFITICTEKRLPLLGKIENSVLILNSAGVMVFDKLAELSRFYPELNVDKFIVMPNHLHAIMMIQQGGTTRRSFPTLSDYIRRFKTLTTKLYIDGVKNSIYPKFDKKVWQRSYHDRIIRNEQEYQKTWEYIDTNPIEWQKDSYYY